MLFIEGVIKQSQLYYIFYGHVLVKYYLASCNICHPILYKYDCQLLSSRSSLGFGTLQNHLQFMLHGCNSTLFENMAHSQWTYILSAFNILIGFLKKTKKKTKIQQYINVHLYDYLISLGRYILCSLCLTFSNMQDGVLFTFMWHEVS